MQILKFILAIILAGIISLGAANLIMHHTGKYDMNNLTPFQYWIIFLLVPSVGFGLFVFLASAFAPIRKKITALIVFFLCIIFIGMGAWQHYIDNKDHLPNQYIIRYAGIVLGLITGFILSFLTYKRGRWNAAGE